MPPVTPAGVLEMVLTLAVAVLVTFGQQWLKAHQHQLDAATAAIHDARLRTLAQMAVRAAETAPDLVHLDGPEQRAAAIDFLADFGFSRAIAAVAVDGAYQGLKMAGEIQAAPKVVLPRDAVVVVPIAPAVATSNPAAATAAPS